MMKEMTALLFLAWSAMAAASPCEDLAKIHVANVTITSVAVIKAGRFSPPTTSSPLPTPDFCRLTGVARPSTDSLIHFEVWLPPLKRWNHNLMGVGNGGYSSEMDYAAMAGALRRGFAVTATDTGHIGDDLAFGYGHPEKITDWGYRALHVTTQAAKAVVRRYAGGSPRHAVFLGCSTGGHQALSEVQRFPSDYDGVIAGAPGNNRVRLNVGFLWAWEATHDAKGNAILSNSKRALVNRAAVAACDALDGVTDGIISAPAQCQFDPETLLCKNAEQEDCLTAAQVSAVKKVYSGPRKPATGEQVIAGYMPGSEEGWFFADAEEPPRLEFWKLWVFNSNRWDWRTFDYDRNILYADRKLPAVNAVDPNLSTFRTRGGKLILYSGWADPVGPPMDLVNYYDHVESVMGQLRTASFVRLFMIPGMSHCGGGPGPNSLFADGSGSSVNDERHDMLTALMQWIEQGIAPTYLVASHLTKDRIDRTRPICPYPQVARWDGVGNADAAGSFTCSENPGTH